MSDVLHVIEDLDYGGAQTQLRLLAESSRVASLRRPGGVGAELRKMGVAVEWLGWRYPIDPLVCLRLGRLMRNGCQAVQTWDAPSGRHVLMARRLSGAAPRWLHAVRESVTPDRVERRVWRSADRLVTPSRTIAESLMQGGVSADRVCVLPNGSDAHAVAPCDRGEVLRRFSLPSATKLIVAVARLDRARLAKELVWAADLLRVVHPEVRLVLVGDGPARRRVDRFARSASEPGLATLAGRRADWPDLLAAADIVWCASELPDAPTPLVEAMRAGKPVVANDAPGRDRLITDGESGWLTPWDHRAGWARATARMFEEPDRAKRIARAGRDRVRQVLPMTAMDYSSGVPVAIDATS